MNAQYLGGEVADCIAITPSPPDARATHQVRLAYGLDPPKAKAAFQSQMTLGCITEVNNTFGERHCYVLSAPAGGGAIRQDCAKRFHVSPFLPMDLTDDFRIAPPGERLAVGIAVSDAHGPLLWAVHTARSHVLNDTTLCRVFLTRPLITFKVLVGIGWEAALLWLKRIPVHRKPPLAEAG